MTMQSEGLIFGRENIAYAVLALYSDAVNEKPVVVSLHLGAKMAYAHMQRRPFLRQDAGRSPPVFH